MNGALHVLATALPVLYVVAAFLHGAAFSGDRWARAEPLRRNVLNATLVVHLAWLAVRAFEIGQFPANDLWSTISLVAFSSALLYAFVARLTGHHGSGGVTLGVVFVVQFLATALDTDPPTSRAGGMGAWAVAHVATSAVASAALVLSGVHGLLYVLLFNQMKHRRFGAWFDHLPDLDLLAKMTRRAALVGFVGLTIGLNVGIALAHAENVPGFDYKHPEVLFSLLLWLHFGVIAFSQKIRGFGARRASWAAALGFVALVLSLLLVLLPHSFHSKV